MRKVWEYMGDAGDAMTISGRQQPTAYDLFLGMTSEKYFGDTVSSVLRELDKHEAERRIRQDQDPD